MMLVPLASPSLPALLCHNTHQQLHLKLLHGEQEAVLKRGIGLLLTVLAKCKTYPKTILNLASNCNYFASEYAFC